MSVIVIGGGLSGMSAALALSEAGVRVTMLEGSSRLGGRASSVYNKRLGRTIDLGQHALLGCCTNLLDFYRRIEATDCIEFHDSLAFSEKDCIRSLKLSRLPEPLHLLPSLLGSSSLSVSDKLRASRLIGEPAHRSLEGLTASEWLRRLGQSPSSIKAFWEPVLVGALNENLDRAGAEYASMVVRLAMMGNREGFRMGVHRQPLSEANHSRGLRALVNRDVDVHFGECAVNVERDGNSHEFSVRTRAGSEFRAERLVFAGSLDSSALFPPDVFRTRDDEAAVSKTVHVPIVTLYLWFSGFVDIPKVLCMPEGKFHWCIDRTSFDESRKEKGSAVSLVWSSARDAAAKPNIEITALGLRELESVLGKLPRVEESLVVRMRSATFSPTPCSRRTRPVNRTSITGLFLAGEWCDTGWPGTMESAVRSGYMCASEMLEDMGIASDVPVLDLPPRGLSKLIGRQ